MRRMLLGWLSAACVAAASSARAQAADYAVLQDVQVLGRRVVLKLSRPAGFRTAMQPTPPALVVTLEETEIAQVAREKSAISAVVEGLESSQVRIDGVPRARVTIRLDAIRAYTPLWSGGDLVLELGELMSGKAAAAAPSPPAATKAPAPPASAPAGAAAAGRPWRFKGRLTDPSGKPLSGTHPVTFRLRPAGDASKEVWSETLQVRVSDGVFWAVLGRTKPLPPGASKGHKLSVESPSGTAKESLFWVQAGSLPKEERALKLKGELEPKVGKLEVRKVEVAGAPVYRVLAGPFEDRASAEAALEKLAAAGTQGLIIQD
ncbi:MAG: SPOR domain-containing protein [Elusimicrobia bacterium]|nr:SPOR domain-containing protein [Elusimicrobiota bacterium]